MATVKEFKPLKAGSKAMQSFIEGLRKNNEYVGMGNGAKREQAYPLFPHEKNVIHQFYIFAQSPLGQMTYNDDGEISHPDVTKYYVEKYCELNHLKR